MIYWLADINQPTNAITRSGGQLGEVVPECRGSVKC